MEKELKITAKLYECRDSMKLLFGDNFKKELEPYTYIIKEVMKANKISEMHAVIKIGKTEMYQEDPTNQIMFMAALVEMIEPSK